MEINSCPARLNTSKPTGAVSQLSNQLQDPPKYDGVTIQQMQGNPIYTKFDSIDKVGLAQKEIASAAQAVSKSKFVRALNDKMKAAKPVAK